MYSRSAELLGKAVVPGRGGGSRTLGAAAVVAVIMTRNAAMVIVSAIAGLRRWRWGRQLVWAIRLALVRGEPSFERDTMVSYVCAAPALVTVIVSTALPVFVTKCPFTVNTHTLCAVGVGLRFWWWAHNATAVGLQFGVFLYGHFQGIQFTFGGEGGWGSFVYHLSARGELVLR